MEVRPSILVTGASGLLGANFLWEARGGYDLVAVRFSHFFRLPGTVVVKSDLTRASEVFDLIDAYRPHWIVHCAALTNVDLCEEEPAEAYKVNVEMTGNLVAAARRTGARIVYISTDSVFDGVCGRYSEEDAPRPVNVYARTKLIGERIVLHDLDRSLVVRTNIYGWNLQNKDSLAEWILGRLELGQQVPGFQDVFFTPILVNDLAKILLEMMDKGLHGVYHVVGGERCSKFNFAQRLAEVFALEKTLVVPASLHTSHLRAPRPRDTSLVTEKVCQALGRRMPDIGQGLERFKSLRDNGFVLQLKACQG